LVLLWTLPAWFFCELYLLGSSVNFTCLVLLWTLPAWFFCGLYLLGSSVNFTCLVLLWTLPAWFFCELYLLGSSVNFTCLVLLCFSWSFSADVEWVDWGLKESGVKDIKTDGTLVALRPTGPVRFFPWVPPGYSGRVSGIYSSLGEAIFTLLLFMVVRFDQGLPLTQSLIMRDCLS